MNRHGMLVVFLTFVCLGTAMAAWARTPERPWEPDPRWKQVQLSGKAAWLPIRVVGYDEPWEQVVQDVQSRLAARVSGREARVGFYGHGAFVAPAAVQHDVLFVAALGVAAEMDVMIFPQWRFPETNPLWDIPRQLLHEQLHTLLKNPAGLLAEVAKSKMRQLALENRYATAHAAVRLAEGIRAFHRQHMTPALAAFSNSALVIVRLGYLLEQGTLSDGRDTLAVADDVRQGVYIRDVVTFGYPLPSGQVSAALRQRIQSTFVNVVPTQCWQQLAGNFLLRGSVKNVPVPWAPTHAAWPHLSPQGPEVAVLGAFLGGRAVTGRLSAALRQPAAGSSPVAKWSEAVCDHLQALESVVTSDRP